MSEAFILTVDGRDIELTPDNHGWAAFRDQPEVDYLDISEEIGTPEEPETKHTLIFRYRWLMLWMGRVAVLEGDAEHILDLEREHGTFRDRTGFNSNAYVEDRPSDFEMEMYTQSLLADLRKSSGMPEEFLDNEN